MLDILIRRILTHLADPRYQPRDLKNLARDFGITADQQDSFRQAAQRLLDDGQVVLGAADALVLPPPGREMIGTFRLNERGFGFIVPDPPSVQGDLFVPPGNTGDALTGDRVRAEVIPAVRGPGRSPYVGRIVQIIQRADKTYVGTLTKRGSHWIVEVDSKRLPCPVMIRDPHAKNARAGDKVVVELIEYPTDNQLPEGVITEVLGEGGEPDVETLAVMRAFGLDDHFPEAVLDDARAQARAFDERTAMTGREDLTGIFTLTIDPPDAKDYDDALTLRRLNPADEAGAAYELGVHIADVCHFVQLGSSLNEEARTRGNSTYLPRKVVPMLPELLSNGVCSLQENAVRLCKTAFIRYDTRGHVLGSRYANTVIRSDKRLTYIEAQALIDDDLRLARKHAATAPNYSQQLIDQLKLMNELACLIQKRRLAQGMIVLDLPEVELVFDDTGNVIDAVPEDNAYTHKLIEMFMVEANEAVARLFDYLTVPLIRRIHPDPPSHDMGELRRFARVAGYTIPLHPTPQELQTLLDAVRGKPQQHAVHLAVLQTLSRAEYAPLLIGHFALASEHYTHFTSPIRRYPDLLVHRALEAYFEHHPEHRRRPFPAGRAKSELGRSLIHDPRCPDQKTLTELGRHCSTTERNSEAAERELRNYLVLDFLADHLGQDFPGTVTGVTNSGVFIQIDRFLVDGFIRLSELPALGTSGTSDRWRFNRTVGCLVAERSGKTISIGDRFTVRIANVDPAMRRLDLLLIGDRHAVAATKSSGRRQPKGARTAHQATLSLKKNKSRRNHKNHKKNDSSRRGKRRRK